MPLCAVPLVAVPVHEVFHGLSPGGWALGTGSLCFLIDVSHGHDSPDTLFGRDSEHLFDDVWAVVTMGYVDEETHKTRPKSPAAGRKAAEDFVHWDGY